MGKFKTLKFRGRREIFPVKMTPGFKKNMLFRQNLEWGIFWLSAEWDGEVGWRGTARREKGSGLKVIFKDDW